MRDKTIRIDDVRRGTYTALGYRSARVASEEGRAYSAGSGAAHAEYDRAKLINQSRSFIRDNAIYKGMIERAVNYIIGNGFTLQMGSKSKKYNEKAESLWRQAHRRPEKRQLLTGRKVDRMVCREPLVCGDTGVIKVRGGLIQLIEAEQIAGKRSEAPDGVKKDQYGKPMEFYVSAYNNRGRLQTNAPTAYSPVDFLFITDPDRPSATRGVPPCQSVFPMLHRINDVCDSEAIAWQLLAHMAIAITREEGPEKAWGESKADPNKEGTDTSGELTTRLTELDYALVFHARPGETVSGIDRNIPGRNFSESLRIFLRLLGLPLGLPLELILLDWTKSNYSQSRAVLEQAYQSFIGWQQSLDDEYYRPLLEWRINLWQKAGLIEKRSDGKKHGWIKPTFPWIDQLKEVQAYSAKVERGFSTHTQVCKSLNADREDIVTVRDAEIRDAIKRTQKIETDTGVKVPWQIFCGLEASVAPKKSKDKEDAGADEDDRKKEDDKNE